MNFKNLLPLLMPVAELIWGDDDDSSSDSHHDVASEPEDTKMPPIAASASVCLAQIPWLSPECLEPLLTKMTGVGIILGACLNKAPTVANMLKAQSAEGLSRSALYSEALFYANSSLYSILMKHPFTAVSAACFLNYFH